MVDSTHERLKKIAKKFPNKPGVYFWRDKNGKPLYIGRAGSLKKRIANYFTNRVDPRIEEMTESAHSLDFETTDTLLEAIVLEANLIKQYWPKYNVLEKDGKSFIYMVVTDEDPSAGSGQGFPRLLMVRGRELDKYFSAHPAHSVIASLPVRQAGTRSNPGLKTEDGLPRGYPRNGRKKKQIGTLGIFGPYQSYYLLRKALEIARKIFPYSNCRPPLTDLAKLVSGGRQAPKPCFHHQIGLCPGVCVGAIDAKTYRNNIRNLILFFRGDKKALLKKLQKENPDAILALKQVQDTALLADSDVLLRGNQLIDRRIEGYDISHSGGKNAVGAMVVFENGEPDPFQYRLFNIRGLAPMSSSRTRGSRGPRGLEALDSRLPTGQAGLHGNDSGERGAILPDDLAMLEEVIERRLRHIEWPLPQIIFVDGGANQVKRVDMVLKKHGHVLPVVGLGKGGRHAASAADQDKLVVANVKKTGKELIIASRNLFQQVRNEAHRFSISAQRKRAKKRFLR